MDAHAERRNLEVKAFCPDPDAVRDAATRLTGTAPTVLRQVDTYFDASQARLKLREIDKLAGELIGYRRPDAPRARLSCYHLVAVPDPAALKALLSSALGVRTVVCKRRELWLWHNVRIHLDAVEKLGNFIELEAVLSDAADELESRRRLDQLTATLSIQPEHHVATSYAELMLGDSPTKTPR